MSSTGAGRTAGTGYCGGGLATWNAIEQSRTHVRKYGNPRYAVSSPWPRVPAIVRPGYSSGVNDRISAWRDEIDQLDDQLLDLFNRRAHCAIEIGMLKRRAQLPIDVPEREAQVIARVVQLNEGPLNGDAIRRLFEAVITESRIAEHAMLEATPTTFAE